MRGWLKKLVCFVLAVLIVPVCAPATAKAERYVSYKGIDLTPLNIYCGYRDVELTILRGGLPSFKGGLRDITREELDRLCADVIREMNTTERAVLESNKASKEYEELAAKLDAMVGAGGIIKAAALAALGAIPGAAGVAGTTLGTTINIKDGDGGWTSAATSVGWGGVGVAAGLAAGPLGSIFVSLVQFGWNQYDLWQMKQEMESKLAEARLYHDFLARLRKKIAEYKKTNGIKREIVFTNARSSRQFYFYSVGDNHCQWELNMTLRPDKDTGQIEGTYTGEFKIFVAYNMAGFLSNPRNAYNNAIGGGLDTLDSVQSQSKWTTTNYNNGGVAEIERTITGKATAIIDENGKVDFKFEQDDDLKATNIANLGYTLSVVSSAPEIGEYWRASGDYAFASNYSGSDNPPIKIQGQGETRWWLHQLFAQIEGNAREQWENDNKKWQKEFEFDEQAWRPWDKPNPPTEMRIMGSFTR